ncbi:hypothetical protein DUI87_11526 [Hirundo rustica rustica]|uniref:Integrase-type domain-containing protein n=1 Tax=Hirundo rustica rustica TaxID=333673 RepID=A0A3M0KWB9_HIRRU|nr:hypothetical protein DUI87_11526 [Hirundo rustica rustica]
MTEPQLGTQALQREGGGWNVTATLTNTGQTENCFALADASPLKSEDPPPPIPILEGPQKCSDDLQLTDWHEVTREICKEENLNPLAMPVIFSQQAGGPRTGTPIPSQDMKELQKVIKDSGICSSYFKELLKNTLERTHQTIKHILSQVKRGKAQVTPPKKRLKKAQYVYHFLNSSAKEPHPHIYRHFLNTKKVKLKEHPPVSIKNLESKQSEKPHNPVTWGKRFAFASTERGLKWVPVKNVKLYHASKPADTPTSASTSANQEANTQT